MCVGVESGFDTICVISVCVYEVVRVNSPFGCVDEAVRLYKRRTFAKRDAKGLDKIPDQVIASKSCGKTFMTALQRSWKVVEDAGWTFYRGRPHDLGSTVHTSRHHPPVNFHVHKSTVPLAQGLTQG